MRNGVQVMFPLQAGGGSVEGALVYKDTVSSASDLPSSSEAQVGWLYIADTAFLLNGEQIEIGDELYWNGTRWNIVQGNITVEPYWEVKSFRIRPSGGDMIVVSELYKNNSLYNGYVTLRVVDSQKWGRWNLPQRQCVDGSVTFYFDNTTNEIMSDPAVTDLVFFLIVDGKIIYSQGYGRNASGIVSGEKGYANGDQVKTYVDNNGFNPSSMALVTDPVTLNTPQADWNQADNTAPDYIKNKPTVSEVWQICNIRYQSDQVPNRICFEVYRMGIQYTTNLYYTVTLQPDDYLGITVVNGVATYSSQGQWHYTENISNPNNKSSIFSIALFTDSQRTNLVCSEVFTRTRKAVSIADGDNGYTTGDQVYDYVAAQVGNIETLLAQI